MQQDIEPFYESTSPGTDARWSSPAATHVLSFSRSSHCMMRNLRLWRVARATLRAAPNHARPPAAPAAACACTRGCRYYAHRSAPTASAASALAPLLQSTELLWVSAVEAQAELSPQEAQAVRMWLTSTDADESYVKRGIGKSVLFHLLLYSQR